MMLWFLVCVVVGLFGFVCCFMFAFDVVCLCCLIVAAITFGVLRLLI